MFTRNKEKHKPGSVLLWGNVCYITNPILKSFKNSEHIKLQGVVCLKGTYTVRETDSPSLRTHLCLKDDDVYKTTFIRYLQIDGKFEETRLDKLFLVILS